MRPGHRPCGSSLACKGQRRIEPKLFGGYQAVDGLLVISVEATSIEDARARISAVAPLVNVPGAAGLILLEMDLPSRKVPLFMDGYFEATGRVKTEGHSKRAGALDANALDSMTH